MSKYYRTLGRIEAVWNRLGGEEGVDRFLRGELVVSEKCTWHERDGVISFSVTSDGATGEEWINRLESKGFRLRDHAKRLLSSNDFKSTDGVTYEIAVLKGMLFGVDGRVTKKIRAEAGSRGLTTPNAEVACLIREKFSDEELEAMGLWRIVTMHEPINSDGDPSLLSANRYDGGGWLSACVDDPGLRWDREFGFAFVVSRK